MTRIYVHWMPSCFNMVANPILDGTVVFFSILYVLEVTSSSRSIWKQRMTRCVLTTETWHLSQDFTVLFVRPDLWGKIGWMREKAGIKIWRRIYIFRSDMDISLWGWILQVLRAINVWSFRNACWVTEISNQQDITRSTYVVKIPI